MSNVLFKINVFKYIGHLYEIIDTLNSGMKIVDMQKEYQQI